LIAVARLIGVFHELPHLVDPTEERADIVHRS